MPSGKFSQPANTPMTFNGRFNSAIAFIVPKTDAAPHISYFISSISAAGFKEIPPASKVKPLPTNTIGFAFLSGALLKCKIDI